ncbi:hypothetical protein RCL1_003147 [Eukaryota sp. TZLM3-RCL]
MYENAERYNETTLLSSLLFVVENSKWNGREWNFVVVYLSIIVGASDRTDLVAQIRTGLREHRVNVVFIVPEYHQSAYSELGKELGTGPDEEDTEKCTDRSNGQCGHKTLNFASFNSIAGSVLIDLVRNSMYDELHQRSEVIIRVEVEEQPEGIIFEPVQTEIRVVLNNETHQVPVFFRAYTEECMEVVELFERQENKNQTNGNNNNQNNGNNNENGEFIREAVVRITVEQEEDEENGNNDNNNNQNEEQTVVFKLVRCPCLVAYQQPRCGFLNHPQQVQAST